MKTTISFVLPCLNEEEGLKFCIAKIKEVIHDLGIGGEIIVVDNGSVDNSAEVAKSMGGKVVYESKKGYGSAYKRGFKEACGDFIAALDPDGSYDPMDIKKMFSLLTHSNIQFISGNRFVNLNRRSMSSILIFGNYLISFLCRIMFLVSIQDTQSGMWLFRKKLLDVLQLKEDGMGFSTEIKLKAYRRFNFLEVPISYFPRLGRKKMNILKHGFQVFYYLIKQRILNN